MSIALALPTSGRLAMGRHVETTQERRPIRRPIRTAQPAAKDGPRINEEIRVREVQLIDKDGANKGVTEIGAAIAMAQEAGLDLVEIAPELRPAGLQNSRLRQIQISGAEEGGRGAQEAEGRRDQGDQAPADDRRSRLRGEDALDAALLRGRRQGQGDVALPRPRNGAPGARHKLLDRVKGDTAKIAKIEQEPRFEGRQMVMVLAPR